MSQSRPETSSLEPYVALLRRGWTTLLSVVLTFAVLAAAASAVFPAGYEAGARVQVLPLPPASDPPPINIATEAEVAESPVVARRVAAGREELTTSELLEGVRVDAQLGSEVLDIVYTAGTADAARSLANAFAHAYIEERRALAQRSIDVALEQVNERIEEVRRQLEVAEDARPPDRRVSAEERVLFRSLDALMNRRADLETSSAQVRGAVVIQPAEKAEPTRSVLKNTLVGLILGFGFGMSILLIRPVLSGRFTTVHDLERTVGAPVLAELHVPPEEAAYQRLSATIRASLGSTKRRLLLAGIGRQTVLNRDAVGLAQALAETGTQVTLLLPVGEADLDVGPGLALHDWLAASDPVDQRMLRRTRLPTLGVIGGGNAAFDTDLLLTERFNVLLRHLGEGAGFVLVSLPSLMESPAAISASKDVDVALLLLDNASRAETLAAIKDLRRAGMEIAGCVWHRHSSG